MKIDKWKADSNTKLSEIDPDSTQGAESKETAEERVEECRIKMQRWQEKLYSQKNCALLIILQAMDTAGKDGIIKHVMTGINPQGTDVFPFKQPTSEELSHDYLWRAAKKLPEYGKIGIFNRSYYEDVLITKVHDMVPDLLTKGQSDKDFWKMRYRQIRDFERYLVENKIIPVKIFLHISKEEQKRRLLERIDIPDKNWKFSSADIQERKFWEDYQKAYTKAIQETSTEYAPWYVVPSNKKWYSRLAVSEIVLHYLKELEVDFPKLPESEREKLLKYREILNQDES